ncbi:MAG: pyridoxal phosphate-dependent decarboxylase family protein [Steroidobacterales bacterium]
MRYLNSLSHRSVIPEPIDIAGLARLDEPLPQEPTDPKRVLALLDEIVSPATVAMAGPRFFGFVTGGSLPAALAANWLAGAWDQNAGFYASTPGVAHLESVALRWLNGIFGFAPSTAGAFVTGATMANFTALAAARHQVLERVGWPVEAKGLFGAPPIEVVVGAEAHPTLFKSLGLLGLGRTRVTRVPVDGQGRMRADSLPQFSGPTILCLQAGNVNTGSFDPFEAIIPVAHRASAWVHVDGAFGLWANACGEYRALARGIELADSWATDAHKWLNVPYDSGLVFVREGAALQAAMAVAADYLPTETVFRNPSDFTPELSRRARGVEVWAALRSLGCHGLDGMIARCCHFARRFADVLGAAGFEILNEVVLNQVLVSFGTPDATRRVIDAVQADGTCWAGVTVWQGRTAMRISVSCWATTIHDVERSAAAIIRIAHQQAIIYR